MDNDIEFLQKCVCMCGCVQMTTKRVGNAFDDDDPGEPMCDSCFDGDDCDGITPGVFAHLAEVEEKIKSGEQNLVPFGMTGAGTMVMVTEDMADMPEEIAQVLGMFAEALSEYEERGKDCE